MRYRQRLLIVTAMLFLGLSYGINANFQASSLKKVQSQQQELTAVEGQPSAELNGHWQALSARSSEPVSVSWSPRTGTPAAIFGKLSGANGNISEINARGFFRENAQLFKMSGQLDDLSLARNFTSPMGSHYIFQQTYLGVPVYGAESAVHFNRAGEVVAVNNSYLPDINLASVVPAVTLDRAFDVARIALLRDNFAQALSELVIYDFNRTATLAWHITVPTNGPTWDLFIDAQRGTLLGAPTDINKYVVNGTGKVFRVNAVVATQNNSLRDNNNAASAVPANAYITVTLPGLVGNGLLDGQYASSSDSKHRASSATNNFSFDRSSDSFSETMGYYYIDYAERYIQSLGFTNVNNRQQVFAVDAYRKDNSFYTGSTKKITYGIGGVDDAEDAEILLHEYGHSIQDNQVPGFGSTLESGSMGEGFGDYWGASVNAQLSNGFQDTCVGEWDATSYSTSNPPCLRRLDTTKHYPESKVGEVHADGEIWSGALWQVRTAIGAARADKVILQSHFLLPAGATFNQGAQAVVTAARNLGYTATEVTSIITAMRNRGFTVN